MQVFFSILVWLFVATTSTVFFILDFLLWLLTFWWDRRLWILHRYSSYWAMFYIYINPFWKIRINGGENIKKDQVYIIVSNHQSAFDIAFLYRLFFHFKWVAKKELFNIPIIGWNLRLNRYVRVDRNSIKSAMQMMKDADKQLKQGSSILIFPEGTRSPDGQIKRFKEGAFMLAKNARVPILPVVVNGTMAVLPRSGVIKFRQVLTLNIYPEIPVSYIQLKTPGELTKEVQHFITQQHKNIAPEYYK